MYNPDSVPGIPIYNRISFLVIRNVQYAQINKSQFEIRRRPIPFPHPTEKVLILRLRNKMREWEHSARANMILKNCKINTLKSSRQKEVVPVIFELMLQK